MVLVTKSECTEERSGYTFDREFFATLKAIYALESCGYSLEENFLSTEPGLETGVYNSEHFLALLLQGAEEKQLPPDWLPGMAKDLREAEADAAPEVKFRLFADWLKDNTGLNLQEYLGEEAWGTVEEKMGRH